MQVTVSKTVYEKINLSKQNIAEITRSRLLSLVGGEYLAVRKKETWVCQDDPDHRHGSVSTQYIRLATELDTAVFLVLNAINDDKNI